jgi:CDP-diacylglycerol--glycerol-3-phosphate 3-phosphatidyltransferase
MEKQEERKSSLLDGWNAPPNLVTYSRIVLVVFFLTLDILAGAYKPHAISSHSYN